MWTGGVRVIITDEKNRILMVRQHHVERDVWMVPGGGIEEGENSLEAAVREVKEETGLDIEIDRMLWHVEETGERGQRFVNVFLAKATDGEAVLGSDPELGENEQVLEEICFMSRAEISALVNVYPEFIRNEFWDMLENEKLNYDAFRMREGYTT